MKKRQIIAISISAILAFLAAASLDFNWFGFFCAYIVFGLSMMVYKVFFSHPSDKKKVK